jgi:hypothetical protein
MPMGYQTQPDTAVVLNGTVTALQATNGFLHLTAILNQ